MWSFAEFLIGIFSFCALNNALIYLDSTFRSKYIAFMLKSESKKKCNLESSYT